MIESDLERTAHSTLSEQDRIDLACDRFEAAWKRKESPRIEDYLAEAAPAERAVLLCELLILELAYRRRRGEKPIPGDYLRRFPGPEDAELIVAAFVRDSSAPPRFTRHVKHEVGGLGCVYTAHDAELNRVVAIKKIRDDRPCDLQGRARFLREAEITGQLEHPGVVPVYSLDRSDCGRPYYAMQFVQGETLTSAIKRFHATAGKAADPAARSLALRGLLQRFINVCNTVDYAHSRGIVHRDLKPDNVMLGRFGETFVLDWGLAKLMDSAPEPSATEPPLTPAISGDSSDTQPGSCLGTPRYMSPEQAAGAHDHLGAESDVYSIGSTLYHLLAGQPPFAEDDDVASLLEKAKAGTFPPPRTLRPDIPRPLEAICQKAMSKHASERYASARALAGDIEHWLADQPVSALAESPRSRALRWMRQHAAAAQGAGVVLIFTTVLSIAGALLLAQARGGERQARQQATAALTAAETRGQLAIDAMRLFRDVLAASEELKGREDLRPVLGRLLGEQFGFFTALRDQLQSSSDTRPGSLDRLAHASFDLGVTARQLGNRGDALRAFQEALSIWERIARQNSTSIDLQNNLASTLSHLGDLKREMGEPSDALLFCRRALEIRERLVRENPRVSRFERDLCRSQNQLASLLGATGKPSAALEMDRRALAILEPLAEKSPSDTDIQSELGWTYMQIGSLLRQLGQATEALDSYAKALPIQERLTRENPARPWLQRDVAVNYHDVGVLKGAAKRPQDALLYHRKALEIRERLARENPTVREFRRELAASYEFIGELQRRIGTRDDALRSLQQALTIRERLTREDAASAEFLSEFGWSCMSTGSLLGEIGKAREALDYYAKALPVQERLARENPLHAWFRRDVASNYNDVGVLNRALGRRGEALQAHEKAARIREQLARDDPLIVPFQVDLATSYKYIGELQSEMGRPGDARESHRKAREILERLARALG